MRLYDRPILNIGLIEFTKLLKHSDSYKISPARLTSTSVCLSANIITVIHVLKLKPFQRGDRLYTS